MPSDTRDVTAVIYGHDFFIQRVSPRTASHDPIALASLNLNKHVRRASRVNAAVSNTQEEIFVNIPSSPGERNQYCFNERARPSAVNP